MVVESESSPAAFWAQGELEAACEAELLLEFSFWFDGGFWLESCASNWLVTSHEGGN